MTQSNPLQKYFRQPKIYISLPSKGMYYAQDSFQGDYNNVPIFAMTGMDEILMKTPDALFNGEATTKVIESCCPYVKNAKGIPSLDIDSLIVAIRIATYGPEMAIEQTCSNCGAENNFDVSLSTVIDQYQNKTFDSQLSIEDFVVNFRPLTYEEMTAFDLENFKLQRMLSQILDQDPEKQQQFLDEIYQNLAEIQLKFATACIDFIQTPTDKVTDKEFIKEWLQNSPKDSFKLVKDKLEANKDAWSLPKFKSKCTECGTENQFNITLDQSNFFG